MLIGPSTEGDFSMRMFNADGSEAEMCGNASRCVAKYLYERGLTKKGRLLDTKAGIKYLQLFIDPQTDTVERVRVNMGKAAFSSQSIPVISELPEVIDQPLTIAGKEFRITCVSMGNPHTVIFMSGIDKLKIDEIGPKIENHPMFLNEPMWNLLKSLIGTRSKCAYGNVGVEKHLLAAQVLVLRWLPVSLMIIATHASLCN